MYIVLSTPKNIYILFFLFLQAHDGDPFKGEGPANVSSETRDSSEADNTLSSCSIMWELINKHVFFFFYHAIYVNVFFFFFLAFATRLFSVLRYESVIHEFDPYFNYRTTKFLAEDGFYKFLNWFDDRVWYPLGRIIGGSFT